jgi:catechol 2,3-dioxygenase-like lactoylglutathione lyase family enzyme
MTVGITGLRQVAVHAADLDATVAFYRDVLGLRFVAKFDPPGLAFFDVGGVRVLFEHSAPPGILYYRVEDIEAATATLRRLGVAIDEGPVAVHRDEDGTFGPAGETEWMVFCKDPSGNTLALASRRP